METSASTLSEKSVSSANQPAEGVVSTFVTAKNNQKRKGGGFYKRIGEVMRVSLSEPGRGCYTEAIPFV